MGIPIPMYSLMIAVGAIGFLIYYKCRVERSDGIDRITSNRLIFVSILGFIVLGTSAFIFDGIFHSIEEGVLRFGGITWLGGVLGLIPAMYYLIHTLVPKERGNEINRFSTMLPGLVLAHAFGRLGCFFGGCCYGGPTDSFLGVVYPAGSHASHEFPDKSVPPTEILGDAGEVVELVYPSLKLLPTQLIEAVFEMILFIVMLSLYKRCKKYNVEIYCFAYGTFRFVLEFFRGDNRGTTGIGITPSQLMSIILFIYATLLILYRNRIIFKKLYSKCEIWRSIAKDAPAASASKNLFQTSEQKAAASIRELHKLKEEGIITEEEFEKKKKEILKRM